MPNIKKTKHKVHKKWGKLSATIQIRCTNETQLLVKKKGSAWLRKIIEKALKTK